MIVFASCSKDNESLKEIKNLSGETWYDAQVWFMDSPESENLAGYQNVGDVGIGESCTVDSDNAYFYIYAKNSRGKLIMSKPKSLSSSNSVKENDLL